MKDAERLPTPKQQISDPPAQQGQDAREIDNIDDLLSPFNSPIGSVEDDFAIADRLLRDLQPDYNYQSVDDQWDAVTLPISADNGDSDFSQSAHNENILTGFALSLCNVGQQDIR